MIDRQKAITFFDSSFSLENEFIPFSHFERWLEKRLSENIFSVEEIPFHLLEQWYFEDSTKNLRHLSGKFFSVEGLRIKTNFGNVRSWDQPIIVQPEVGILGIITRVINNQRYFLMQAKMEPGNINLLQVSPTVQATRSNYTKVHNGNLPKYLEYFLDNSRSEILVDLLQPEQSGRFFRKQNRNMVVEVHEDIPVHDDFIWLTLGQIKKALLKDNLVNMDSRSVIATIPFMMICDNFEDSPGYPFNKEIAASDYAKELIISANSAKSANSNLDIREWISTMKSSYYLDVSRIPVSETNNWIVTENNITHLSGSFFKVIAVKVKAGNREVVTWTQPLIKEDNPGLIGFLVKRINGVLHFLVQAKVEPGCLDTLDLSPTVTCSDYRNTLTSQIKPHFIEYFDNQDPGSVLYSVIQSEEGGRFFHFRNLNVIVRIKDDELKDTPPEFKWLTLHQIMELMHEGLMNIEARSLISALSLI